MLGSAPKNHPHQVQKRGVDDEVDDRETPASVFGPLDVEFGFTLDVAAARHNAKCKRYFAREPCPPEEARQPSLFPRVWTGDIDALAYDGLIQVWDAPEIIWANPPFSGLYPWVQKAHLSAATVVMLLPANRTEQPWWQEFIEPYRDQGACLPRTRFLGGRRSFLSAGETIGNSTSKNPPFGIVIVIWDRRTPP